MPSRRQILPPARVVSGPAFELVAELAAFASGPARASLESGKAWIREVRRLAGRELISRVDRWGFSLYAELASYALDAGPPFEPRGLVAELRRVAPGDLQRRLLGAESAPNRAMVSQGAFDRALAGDASARAEVRRALGPNARARQGIERLFATPAAALQDDVAWIVEAWAERVFPAFETAALELIRRDVPARERLFREKPTSEALRIVTNGVEVDPTGWATSIVVVPTVALRPFLAPVESGTRLIILSAVGDEAFEDDAGGPPRRLVKVAAALGDEIRLRILRELGDGDVTAAELGDRLGVERTSLHHHLGILRSAGLVTVRAEGVQSWRYSVQQADLAAATRALSRYLTSAEERQPEA